MKLNFFTVLLVIAVIAISLLFYFVGHRKNGSGGSQTPIAVSPEKTTVYVLLGAPGAGKGSLSDKLIENLGFTHISTGNMFRYHKEHQTEIGKKVGEILKSGGLVPDDIVINMVREALPSAVAQGAAKGLLLDGFPRSKNQAEALISFTKDPAFKMFDFIGVLLKVPSLDMLLDRLTSRVMCSNPECQTPYNLKSMSESEKAEMKCPKCGAPITKRSDDEISTVKKRLDTYAQAEHDILAVFERAKLPVISVDASVSIQHTYDDFVRQRAEK